MAFPTPEWLDQYAKRLNESKEMAESGKGWGLDFQGDFIFQIDDVPVEKIEKIEKMSDQELKKIAEKVKMSLDEGKKLIEKVKVIMKEYVKGKTVYTWIGLKDGKCTGARVIKDPSEVKAGFKLMGSYDSWKKLAKAEADAMRLVMTGKMKLQGDMSKVMRYVKATQTMAKIASEVPTEFLDELVP